MQVYTKISSSGIMPKEEILILDGRLLLINIF